MVKASDLRHILGALLGLVPFALGLAVSAEASPGRAAHREANAQTVGHQLPAGKHRLAPFAHAVFCVRHPDQCVVRRRSIRRGGIAATPERLLELGRVNAAVNAMISPQPDAPGLLGDEWRINPRRGDCDDYAVSKRAMLIERGWPSRALLLATAKLPDGQDHLILVARTVNGDFVLDNLRRDVLPVSRVGYRWDMIQDEDNPRFWRSVDRGQRLIAMPARPIDLGVRLASRQRALQVVALSWELRGPYAE